MYEETSGTVTTALTTSSAAVFNASTISTILSLTTKSNDVKVRFDDVAPDASGNTTVDAGAEVVFIKTSDTVQTTVHAPVNAPIVIFQGKGGVNATLNDGATTVDSAAGVVDRVVVGTTAADKIVIADGKNSLVTIGQGDTVVAGAGSDTIVAGSGDTTVQGGTGRAIVQLGGAADDYTVTVVGGRAVVENNSSGNSTDITKIQFVQLDNGEALIFAKDKAEAAVTSLYEATFGRTADANGLQYWFDQAKAGTSLDAIANAFVNSEEYTALGTQTDSSFVNNLYLNTFGRTADSAGLVYWTNLLATGQADRADVLESFTTVAANNLGGDSTGEATIVGSIHIISTII